MPSLSYRGYMFVNGKILGLIGVFLVAFSISSLRKSYIVAFFGLLLFFGVLPYLTLEKLQIVTYRIEQIRNFLIFGFDLDDFKINSMNNILAEGYILVDNLLKHPESIVFGFGLGGGIKDYQSVLVLWEHNGAYAKTFIENDQYLKLHLSIYDLVMKFGLIGLFFCVYILTFVRKNYYDFIFLSSLIFVFSTANKEMALITILCVMLSIKKSRLYRCNNYDKKVI